MRFKCTRCGNCCTGTPGYVWLSDEELAALAARVELTEAEFKAVYVRRVGKRLSLREKPNGDCVFYERGKGCTVYDLRPEQCRTWPFWESTTDSPEAWERMKEDCPGAGRGRLFTADEITARVRARRV